MALSTWTYRPEQWPPTFGRLWLWTMGSERANQDRVIRVAREIGATDVIVLINNPPKKAPSFAMTPNRAMTVELSAKIRAAGMDYHVSSWLDPNPNYVNQAAAELRQLVKETGAKSLCFDVEGEWRKRISNHTQFVASVVAPAFKGFPVPIGVTSFASLPKEVAPLLAWAVEHHNGYGQPQIYGTDTGEKWQQIASVKPDKIAALGWRTWSPFTKNLVGLVAAFGNPHAGWNQANQLEAQLMRAQHEGFVEAAVWVEEAFAGASQTSKTRRAVLAEVEKTGVSSVVDGSASIKPLLYGTGIVAAGALTHRLWLPGLGRVWRFVRGG